MSTRPTLRAPRSSGSRSRVIEYALDTTADTATVVRSYAPPGRFAIFAGSAQRLGNGNTVIGWAASTGALASEIALDGTLLWELRDPGASPKWFSYRAHKAVVPDAIPPEVDVAVPAEGATYVEGAAVSPSYDCTDRGGSSLQSCTALPVDTSTPGAHTMTVTGVDGAGRHHDGDPPLHGARRLPSGRDGPAARRDGATPGTASTPRPRSRSAPGSARSAKLEVRVQNDGARADTLTWSVGRSGRFVLRGPRTGNHATAAARRVLDLRAEGAPQEARIWPAGGPRAPARDVGRDPSLRHPDLEAQAPLTPGRCIRSEVAWERRC